MTDRQLGADTMRTIRFHRYGEPTDVLRLEEAAVPSPRAGHVRVLVHACGLNPADWALCRGLFASDLPRGIGLDVSGTVDAVGEGVMDVHVGSRVLGVPDFRGYRHKCTAKYHYYRCTSCGRKASRENPITTS